MSLSLHTNHGTIKILLTSTSDVALNFMALAAAGVYDNTVFHKSVPEFILQGGDPEGTGKGGLTSYTGEPLVARKTASKEYKKGSVFMAGKADSVGSQFFITYSEQELDFHCFGHVQSLDVLEKIEKLAVDKKNRPIDPVRIERVQIHANPFAIPNP